MTNRYTWAIAALLSSSMPAAAQTGKALAGKALHAKRSTDTLGMAAVFAAAEAQTRVLLDAIPKARAARSALTAGGTPGSAGGVLVSPRTLDSGALRLVTARDWTSGFFPGVLWQLYDYTRKPEWKGTAQAYTDLIENEKWNSGTHDMGFKVYCSFGTGYALTNDPRYKDVILQSARTLSTRFNKTAGVLRSWDHNKQKWDFPVIIDNMMNLELLFAASRLSGDSSFYRIAVSHADNTMRNHFRPDYSSYHVVDYDSTAFGSIRKKTTHQGYSDASAWSRGQGWALYGYTMCYRETRDPRYLQQAERVAAYVLQHPNMPKDLVPYWDFNAPGIPAEPRDASAAAVIASGLYELSTYSKEGRRYRAVADKIVQNLTRSYRAPVGTAQGFLLLHSTGSKPANSEVDVPLNYADYYYLEALLRGNKLRKAKRLFP
ncbi:glycoside hydrolase family 88 protein [Flaviaesturariibacter amylovorans]|uniref:Glycoside hydrolase family 88 protein n=1 Tax=Flaviaesturariibacter amylovorans TaxID=1084520 RepID=A0ABP8H6T6_9BACT